MVGFREKFNTIMTTFVTTYISFDNRSENCIGKDNINMIKVFVS